MLTKLVPSFPVPGVLLFTDSAVDSVARTEYTFSSQAIGTPTPDRIVVVSVLYWDASATQATGLTVGGISFGAAQPQVSDTVGGIYYYMIMTTTLVPTGTTADIVITFQSQVNGCAILVHEIRNDQFTAVFSGTDKAVNGDRTVDVDLKTKGNILGIGMQLDSGVPDASFELLNNDPQLDSGDGLPSGVIFGSGRGNGLTYDLEAFEIRWNDDGTSTDLMMMAVATWKPK